MRPIKYILLGLLTSLVVTNCTLDIPVENELTDPMAVSTILSANEVLATSYSTYPKEHVVFSLLSDDYAPEGLAKSDNSLLNLYIWREFEVMIYASALWDGYYNCIMNLNSLMERRDSIAKQIDSLKLPQLDLAMAEAKTLKAMCYMDLLQLFATRYADKAHPEGIILKDTTPMDKLPRSSKEVCIAEINKLLNEAEVLFEKTKEEKAMNDRAVAFCSARSIQALKARLALYQSDYLKVLELIPKVEIPPIPKTATDWAVATDQLGILAGYVLHTFFNNMYLNSADPDQMYYSVSPIYKFDKKDQRYATYVLPYEKIDFIGKYCLVRTQKIETKSAYLIRPQELLFMRAEALARIGNDEDAREEVNAYLRSISAKTISRKLKHGELVNTILREKAKEFVGEAVNIFDKKRLNQPINKYKTGGEAISKTIKASDYRWTFPIPRSEMNTNPNAVQNPGWAIK